MFTIVTHNSPDLDAVGAVWLLKRFLPNWQNAAVKFVPAGKTLNNDIPDSDPHVLHVDTGFGLLDHHQSDEDTCAVKKTYGHIERRLNRENSLGVNRVPPPRWKDEALERMCEVVNFYDHFREAKLPDANADYHLFDTAAVIDGLKNLYPDDDNRIVDTGMVILDAIYRLMKEKVWAEEIIEHEGIRFESSWGEAIAFETLNDAVLKVAQKMGFVVVLRKDPKKGYVRIKGSPGTQVDFSTAYEKLKKMDSQATWFLHSSKKILLNGTTKNPEMKPTRLGLEEIISTIKKT